MIIQVFYFLDSLNSLSRIFFSFMVLETSMVSFANSTSSATSSSTSTHTTISTHGVNPSMLLLSNMASMMTVKLDYNNYLVWRHQIEVILDAYSMINFIEDNLEAPNPLLKDSSGNIPLKLILNISNVGIVNKHYSLSSILLSSVNFGSHSRSEIW